MTVDIDCLIILNLKFQENFVTCT